MKAARAARLTMRTLARLRIDLVKVLDNTPASMTRMMMETQLSAIDTAGEVISDAHGAKWQIIVERERSAALRLSKGPKQTVLS